jgi:glycerol kinase
MNSYLLAIDQGTTSTRAILFDTALNPITIAQQELTQLYPRPGWVEHDPEDLWTTTLSTVTEVLARAGVNAANVAAIGITNQRETAIIWDRKTGRAIHNAIVWQDRRTAERCAELAAQGGTEAVISAKTGLIIDPYFSATKVAWILDHVDGARIAAAHCLPAGFPA